MSRFWVILVMGLVLAALLAVALRWLWRQRGRAATTRRKVLLGGVCMGCLALATLLEGGIEFLWHERPNQPSTAEDLRILDRADALLKDEASWNRNDDKNCEDDKAAQKWSLYCALEAACIEVLGRYEHTRVALQEARFAVEAATDGKPYAGRLMGFNNEPATRFADVKQVLKVARDNVQSRLPPQP